MWGRIFPWLKASENLGVTAVAPVAPVVTSLPPEAVGVTLIPRIYTQTVVL